MMCGSETASDPSMLAICIAARNLAETIEATRLGLLPAAERDRLWRLGRRVMTDAIVEPFIRRDLEVAARVIDQATRPLVIRSWRENEFDPAVGWVVESYPPEVEALRTCRQRVLALIDAMDRQQDEDRAVRLVSGGR